VPIRSTSSTPAAQRARRDARDARGARGVIGGQPKEAPRKGDDAFDGAASFPPFPAHYAASKKLPSWPAGKTLFTFDEAQLRALHRAYWSAPATASIGEMAALAWRDPAFKGRKMDGGTDKQVGRVFEKLPDSFPWGWRSRALAATSCILVGALANAPKGTPVSQVLAALQKQDAQFPTIAAFIRAANDVWPKEPDRFPFAKLMPRDGSGKNAPFKLEATGTATSLPSIRKDGAGRFVMTRQLAEKVRDLAMSPAFEYGWTREQLAAFVDRELKGDGAFTETTYKSARAAFPDVVPDFMVVRKERRERIAHAIHDLYHRDGIKSADGIIRALHERHGTPLWKPTMLTWFRNEFPTLVPDFKIERDLHAYAQARTLLDAVLARPSEPRRHVARDIGFDDKRAKELFALAAKAWPDEFERSGTTAFSTDDVRMLRQAMADVPLNATMRDLMRVLEREHPAFLERHPYSSPESLYANAVVKHGGFAADAGEENMWRALQQQRYVDVLVDVVKRSPPGTQLKEIVNTILDEHDGAYTMSHVQNLLAKVRTAAAAKDVPPSLQKLAALRDRDGAWPWDKSKVKLTRALATHVAAAMAQHPGLSLPKLVTVMMRDTTFAKEHPTFNADTVHHLRAAHPRVIPYLDEPPPSATHEGRVNAQRRELTKIAKQIAKHVDGDDLNGLTIANVARALKMKPHRVLAAVRQEPALFPWYRERPAGRVDLYLATKVAHAIESAPLGTTLEQVVDGLRADKNFRGRYPQFNYFSVTRLRERYPEIVPEVHARNQILRSKILVDALTTAKKGTPYDAVFAAVLREHPGQFPASWAREDYVKALWTSEPERYPFAKGFTKGALTGRGSAVVPNARTTDAELATQLARLEQIPEKLAVLDKIVDGLVSAKSKPFANTEILAIQHLLGPQVAMFDAARKLGMAPGRSSIVGIPSSVSDTVVSTLEDKGFEVRVPPLDLEAWYGMVKDAMEERIASALKHHRKIVVFDDGGLVPMMFERWPHLAEHAHLFRIVEQTTRGITVADGVDLHSPVVNVAQSWAKYVEGPMVGSTVQQKLLRRLAGINVDDIKGKHIGVNGFGTVGAPLAEFLRAQGAIVTVMDLGEDAQKRAREAGFDVVDGNDDKARAKFYGKQDILVGATGHQSMTAADIENMKDGAILGSSSSKLVEIDVETLKALSKRGRIEVIDADSFPPTVRYHLKDGRKIDLLASGFPMNFDGSVEDVAAERIQLTMGLMLAGALQAAGVSAAGLHRLDPRIQLELIRAFHDDVGGDLDDAQGEAVAGAMSLAQTHLRELERKHGAREHDLRHRR
jgi:S-adenosylhomocysteine hydrolase